MDQFPKRQFYCHFGRPSIGDSGSQLIRMLAGFFILATLTFSAGNTVITFNLAVAGVFRHPAAGGLNDSQL